MWTILFQQQNLFFGLLDFGRELFSAQQRISNQSHHAAAHAESEW
jgi:hypothetical protein